MLSLKNSYSADDLLEWSSFIQRQLGEELTYTFLVEPKFDGSSVHIVYRYGRLVQAITRGDGYIGEDITQHVQSIHNIPLYVPGLEKVEELRLRGEIVMPFHAFEKLNKQQARA